MNVKTTEWVSKPLIVNNSSHEKKVTFTLQYKTPFSTYRLNGVCLSTHAIKLDSCVGSGILHFHVTNTLFQYIYNNNLVMLLIHNTARSERPDQYSNYVY